MTGILRADNVSVSFDGLQALLDVSLDVPAGRVTGLIGPNGAGKTTLVNVLTGFQTPTGGKVLMDGKDLTGLESHKIRHLGIARTFQSGRLFGDLTVLDNLEVTGVGLGLRRREAAVKAIDMLDWIGISPLAETIAGSLPYTDERRVAIGRALIENPDFLLLDEPAAGMSEDEAADLIGLIRKVVSELGCGVLLIEHNIGLVLEVCDHINVLDSGEIIEAGTSGEIKVSEKVRHAYMGTQIDAEGAVL